MLGGMSDAERQAPELTAALAQVSADDATRERYLGMERGTSDAGLRARMIEVNPEDTEMSGLFGERVRESAGTALPGLFVA